MDTGGGVIASLVGRNYAESRLTGMQATPRCQRCASHNPALRIIGDAGEYRHNHLPGVRGRISPRLRQRLEFAARLADPFHRVQQISGGSSQAVQLPDHDGVAFSDLIEHPLQFGPLPTGSGDLRPLRKPDDPADLLRREIA